jgi:hypothetical protein
LGESRQHKKTYMLLLSKWEAPPFPMIPYRLADHKIYLTGFTSSEQYVLHFSYLF